jgi:hypothetical protein
VDEVSKVVLRVVSIGTSWGGARGWQRLSSSILLDMPCHFSRPTSFRQLVDQRSALPEAIPSLKSALGRSVHHLYYFSQRSERLFVASHGRLFRVSHRHSVRGVQSMFHFEGFELMQWCIPSIGNRPWDVHICDVVELTCQE